MKNPPFLLFILLIIISLAVVLAETVGLLSPIKRALEYILVPIQKRTFEVSSYIAKQANTLLTTFQKDTLIEKLQEDNVILVSKVAKLDTLRLENEALKTQLGAKRVGDGKPFLEARVIGRKHGIILDKGRLEGVAVGDIAIVKDMLIGKVMNVSERVSVLLPVNSPTSEILARTLETGAEGVVKGDGAGGIVLEHVTLDEKLLETDLVLTSGDIDGKARGFPPHLVIGKIVSIDKKESELFQRAKLKSPIDLEKVGVVFLIQYPDIHE